MPESNSPVRTEILRLIRKTSCGGHLRKHSFQIDRKVHGGVVMACKFTMCQERRVIANAVLKAWVSR